jgi:putative copper resistance protein D
MSYLNALRHLAHWVFLVSAFFISGAFAMRFLVTAPCGADVCTLPGEEKTIGETAARYVVIFSSVALVVNAAHAVLHCSVVTETPLSEVFAIMPTFLKKTKFGRLASLREIILAGALLSSLFFLRRQSRKAALPGIGVSVLLLITLSASGHQGAKGYLAIPFFLDVFHAMAVALWIGGLFYLRVGYVYLLRDAGEELWDVFSSMIKRFSDTATGAVFAVLASGIVLSLYNIKSVSFMIATPYGLVLSLKILLAGSIFLLGGVNKFFLLPAMLEQGETPAGSPRAVSSRRRFYLLVTVEMAAGLCVLLMTSILTHLSPVD